MTFTTNAQAKGPNKGERAISAKDVASLNVPADLCKTLLAAGRVASAAQRVINPDMDGPLETTITRKMDKEIHKALDVSSVLKPGSYKTAPAVTERDKGLQAVVAKVVAEIPKENRDELRDAVSGLVQAYETRDKAHADMIGCNREKPANYYVGASLAVKDALLTTAPYTKQLLEQSADNINAQADVLKEQTAKRDVLAKGADLPEINR
jgi:hypothetical protein